MIRFKFYLLVFLLGVFQVVVSATFETGSAGDIATDANWVGAPNVANERTDNAVDQFNVNHNMTGSLSIGQNDTYTFKTGTNSTITNLTLSGSGFTTLEVEIGATLSITNGITENSAGNHSIIVDGSLSTGTSFVFAGYGGGIVLDVSGSLTVTGNMSYTGNQTGNQILLDSGGDINVGGNFSIMGYNTGFLLDAEDTVHVGGNMTIGGAGGHGVDVAGGGVIDVTATLTNQSPNNTFDGTDGAVIANVLVANSGGSVAFNPTLTLNDLNLSNSTDFSINNATIAGDVDITGSAILRGSGTLDWTSLAMSNSGTIQCVSGGPYGEGDEGTVPNPLDLSTCAVALPVEYISIDIETTIDRCVVLNWTTSEESNNSHYLIEAGAELISFHELGRVEGNGTTSGLSSYSFEDCDEQNKYYRIKQVDFDGASDFSKVLVTTVENDDSVEILKRGDYTIFNNSSSESVLVSVYSLDGKMLFSQEVSSFGFVEYAKTNSIEVLRIMTGMGVEARRF